MISIDDVVLRDDLDPRLGERDDDLIQQYADIFDALPPIEINQKNELIDGWHRVRAAERAERTEIAYVVVETAGDDDLSDKMWAANLKHGVQYTRGQRMTYGVKLHGRGLSAKEIAEQAGVNVHTVNRWTKPLRDKAKQERDQAVVELVDEGKTQREIADELRIDQGTVSRIMQSTQMHEMHKIAASVENTDSESESEAISVDELEPDEVVIGDSEATLERGEAPDTEEDRATLEPEAESETDEASADEEADTSEPEPEPPPPAEIPDEILNTARAVMGAFAETRPDDYVARLDASSSEQMTITDDSLANELERELLTSAAAMCLWQEWMIWYQGERDGAFTDTFGKIGPVFVRGRSGQWSIVSKLRSILRRLRI